MKLAGIELRYLVSNLASEAPGYYVSNIYGISRESLLLKLHHPDKPDIMLMFSTHGMWPSSVRIDPIEENKMQRRLRQELLRARLIKAEQPGSERIAVLTFAVREKTLVLVGEFFGGGNIILCNKDMKILALLHSLDVQHRKLGVGQQYALPPAGGLDVLEITADQARQMLSSNLTAGKWVGRTLGLPTRYVEEIFRSAGLSSKSNCSDISYGDASVLADAAKSLAQTVSGGPHDPIIVRGTQGAEAYPIRAMGAGAVTPMPSFAAALDMVFTEQILESGRQAKSGEAGRRIAELESTLAQQKKAIDTVLAKSKAISSLASALKGAASAGASSLDDPQAAAALKEAGACIISEKGQRMISACESKIPVEHQSSAHAAASRLYDESKRQSAAVPAIRAQIARTERKLGELQARAAQGRESVGFSEVRKKGWYERYRWFKTTTGVLAIGGRDSSSNSAMIRKHMEKEDLVFHAEVFGSPFFLLKGCSSADHVAIGEAAQATVCFSRAWREAMHGASAYWMDPAQVKKAAPSGQYLPRGSFSIEGKRNYVRVPELRLAVGLGRAEGAPVLWCGPLEPVKKGSIIYAVIEPSGIDVADAAKKIRTEFMRMDETLAKPVGIDEFIRVMPAGKTRVAGTGQGEDAPGSII